MEQQVSDLKTAFSAENLTFLTREILKLFKNNQFSAMNLLLRNANGASANETEKDHKVLAKLLMLYHPDKVAFYHHEFERLLRDQNKSRLEHYHHIFFALDFNFNKYEQTVVEVESNDEDLRWEKRETGDSYYSMEADDYDDFNLSEDTDNSFYNVFRRMTYGPENIELPYFLLEDMDEVELCGRNMENLDGIEHCRHLVRLELSDNHLSDVSGLSSLELIEELYLANNQIGLLDALGFLDRLRVLDISDNAIDDISVLNDLNNLEYLNISGNPVSDLQIADFKRSNPDCIVVC